MRLLIQTYCLLLLNCYLNMTLLSISAAEFDHSSTFSKLPDDYYKIIETYYNPSTDWYRSNYNMAKYSGYQELFIKYDGYLPTGSGIVVLQAESYHTPDSIGDVKHLFDFEASNNHSEYVAGILSSIEPYTLIYTRYVTFSPGLDLFHTADTADLRIFFDSLSSINTYPATSYDDIPITPAKVLNISNTNGGSSADLLKQFDQFVQLNDMVACTAQSSLIEGNWTTSGMAYNSIVVDQTYVNSYAFDGAKINDHGSPRFKPDIIAHSRSYASSYSTPTVCSAAAMMLERINEDATLSNAWNSIVMKAILMAGATRFNYKASTEWGEGISQVNLPLFTQGEWSRVSNSQPTSEKYGAGSLHVLSSYNILEAGEFTANAVDTVTNQGWDYVNDILQNQINTYTVNISSTSMFSAVLNWHRVIDDNLTSYLADYSITVYDNDENIVAYSDNLTSNVELIETKLMQGNYRIEVKAKSNGGLSAMSYALAWTTKTIAPKPINIALQNIDNIDTLEWTLTGINTADYKYRIEVSKTANFAEIETEVFTDNAYYIIPTAEDNFQRYYRVYTYPKDSNVAFQYPSTSEELFIDQDIDGLSDSRELELGTNHLLIDTDSDGMPDGWEVDNELNPLLNDANNDIDGDGLINLLEHQHGSNPRVSDTDRDGMNDGYEIDEGFDPLDSSDCPSWICASSKIWLYILQ